MAAVVERRLKDFKPLEKLGEGTFSEVIKVECLTDGKMYAMKRFKRQYKKHEAQACDEIRILNALNPHPNIVGMHHIIYEPTDGILCITFELMECNLYELLSRKGYKIPEQMAKEYTHQIFIALDYIHSKGIFHRDVKPENILIQGNTIKLADFGSCRPINSQPPYTEYIATRWYRSPECILAEGIYDYKMDIWAVGCVLFEMLTKNPLFPGADEFDQIQKIHEVLGSPSHELIQRMYRDRGIHPKFEFKALKGRELASLLPKFSRSCIDLIHATLIYDPTHRISASVALQHPFFRTNLADTTNNKQRRGLHNSQLGSHQSSQQMVNLITSIPQQMLPPLPNANGQVSTNRSKLPQIHTVNIAPQSASNNKSQKVAASSKSITNKKQQAAVIKSPYLLNQNMNNNQLTGNHNAQTSTHHNMLSTTVSHSTLSQQQQNQIIQTNNHHNSTIHHSQQQSHGLMQPLSKYKNSSLKYMSDGKQHPYQPLLKNGKPNFHKLDQKYPSIKPKVYGDYVSSTLNHHGAHGTNTNGVGKGKTKPALDSKLSLPKIQGHYLYLSAKHTSLKEANYQFKP